MNAFTEIILFLFGIVICATYAICLSVVTAAIVIVAVDIVRTVRIVLVELISCFKKKDDKKG